MWIRTKYLFKGLQNLQKFISTHSASTHTRPDISVGVLFILWSHVIIIKWRGRAFLKIFLQWFCKFMYVVVIKIASDVEPPDRSASWQRKYAVCVRSSANHNIYMTTTKKWESHKFCDILNYWFCFIYWRCEGSGFKNYCLRGILRERFPTHIRKFVLNDFSSDIVYFN